MRRLLLARHAKSSWSDIGLTDHDRPLNGRGRRAAPIVAAALDGRGFIPDIVYSSTSRRTRDTWTLMEPRFGGLPRVEYLPELYHASPRAVLDVVAGAPRAANTLMVLGHNPSTHALAAHLARAGSRKRRDRVIRSFPTGAVAVIELAGDDWDAAEAGGQLLDFIVPRLLG